jgi:VWFA-related protein
MTRTPSRLAGALALALIAMPAHAQSERASLALTRVHAIAPDRVRLFLSVLGPGDRPIEGLAPTNFTVRLDGRPVTDWSLETATDGTEPLSLVLALDRSGSMRGAPLDRARVAAQELVDGLRPDDWAAVVTFGDDVRTVIGLTDDRDALRRALDGWQATDAATHLHQAIYDAINRARSAPTALAAVLVLTDGRDEGSALTLDDAIRHATEASLPVYAVGVGAKSDTQSLRRLTVLTGGRFLAAPSPTEIAAQFRRAREQLRGLYALGIPIADAGAGRHTLHVSVRHQGEELAEQRAFEWTVAAGPSRGGEAAAREEPAAEVGRTEPAAEESPRTGTAEPAGEVSAAAGTPPTATEAEVPIRGPSPLLHAAIVGAIALAAVIVAVVFRLRRAKPGAAPTAGTCAVCHERPAADGSLYCAVCTAPAQAGDGARPVPDAAWPWLEVLGGEHSGARAAIPPAGLSIGRGTDNDWVLTGDRKISRRKHAEIRLDPSGTAIIQDRDSANGTRVNAEQITGPTPLRDGDTIRLGDTEIRFHYGAAPRAAREEGGHDASTDSLG